MAETTLTAHDVERLRASNTPETRAALAAKVVPALADPKARQEARALLLHLARDAAVAVRRAVAFHVCNSPHLDGDLAMVLAKDIATVAAPILRAASCISDETLLRIVQEGDKEKQVAIAGRRKMSEDVASSLVWTGDTAVVATLVRNPGAPLSPRLLSLAIDTTDRAAEVAEALASRDGLPAAVVVRIVDLVSEEIRRSLLARSDLPPGVARWALSRGREAALLSVLRPLGLDVADLGRMARALADERRLTPRVAFNALAAGDVDFFVACLAVRAGTSPAQMRQYLFDEFIGGARSALRKAQIPSPMERPFTAALSVLKAFGNEVPEVRRRTYQERVLASVFSACGGTEEPEVADLIDGMWCDKDAEVMDAAMRRAGVDFPPVQRH